MSFPRYPICVYLFHHLKNKQPLPRFSRLKPNDIVYSIRGSIGDAEVVPEDLRDANITQDVARIAPRSEVEYGWLLYVMKSVRVFVQLEQKSLGAAVRGINIFDLKRARIPVPPQAEQLIIEKTILDLPLIYINGGRRGYLVGIDPQDLQRLLSPVVVQVVLK